MGGGWSLAGISYISGWNGFSYYGSSRIRLLSDWETVDFARHYFNGGGKAIDLGVVGLGDDFENSNSVKVEVEKWLVLPKNVGFHEGKSITNVTSDSGLFSVGHSSFYMRSICNYFICFNHFSIHDAFKDPLDIGVEVPGGTPYEINYQFIRVTPRK